MVQTGKEVDIHLEETGNELEKLDPTVRAVLVRKNGLAGCVCVFGKTIKNTIAGLGKVIDHILVLVDADNGEHCRILGTPSVRYLWQRKTSAISEGTQSKSQQKI